MPLVLADRVKETTISTGTGTITLAGTVAGFQSFSVIGDGNTTYYTIAGQGTSEWEVGIGTYTVSGTTLSRDTVLASSAGAPTKTNFSAGTKDVFVTYTAARSVNVDGATIDTFGMGAVQGDLLYASAADNFARLAKNTTATRYLSNTGANNDPQWDQVNLGNGVTGTLAVANGGTGQTTALIPAGVIVMWSGTIASIPSGWALCDGTSGTPDLRNRFIVGASVDSGGQSVTTITGANTKTGGSKDATLPSHAHTTSDPGSFITGSVGMDAGGSAGTFSGPTGAFTVSNSTTIFVGQGGSATNRFNRRFTLTAGSHTHTISTVGSSSTDANLTPYYALAYIMKT